MEKERQEFNARVLAFVPMLESDYRLYEAWLWFKKMVKKKGYSFEEALNNLKILQSKDAGLSKRKKYNNYHIKKIGTVRNHHYYLLLKKKRKQDVLAHLSEIKEKVDKLSLLEAMKRLDELLKQQRIKFFFVEYGKEIVCDWEIKFLAEKLLYHFGKIFFMGNYLLVPASKLAFKLAEFYEFDAVVDEKGEFMFRFKRQR